jgi:hypothetical protein
MVNIFGNQVTSYVIGKEVTSIGEYAFEGCSNLESIVVEKGNTIYDSRNNCNAIIEKSSNLLIVGCKNTTIPNSVTSIGSYAFYGCTSLTSIVIPQSVTSIGDGAFGGCTSLTSIVIPQSVTSIGDGAFGGTGLTSVTIGNGVTRIGDYVFGACTDLTTITIGNSVKSIGSYTFNSCASLKNFYCYAEAVPQTGYDIFYGTDTRNITLHIPAASIDAYKENYIWSKFKAIVALTDSDPKPGEDVTGTGE